MNIALFLAFIKRRQELVLIDYKGNSHRKDLEDHTVPLLDQMMAVVTAVD
jgi:hypothetical protein